MDKLMRKKNKQFGFTLIEMLVGISVGIFVVGGALSFYAASVGSSNDTIKSARLNQDLNAVMQLVVNEVRRAGYGITWEVAPVNVATAGCVLYAYRDDSTGGSDLVSYRGFNLSNNEIQMKTFIEPSPIVDPTVAITSVINCNSAGASLTDGDVISITGFTVTRNAVPRCTTGDGTCTNAATIAAAAAGTQHYVETLQLDITLSGQLVSDNTVNKTLTQSVRVINNMGYAL